MQIQVNTDAHITGGEKLRAEVEAVVEKALRRFADRITRVEVHFRDESSAAKSSDDDKCCQIEVRLAGMQPISVRENSGTVAQSLRGAARRLETTLDRTLGKERGR
jgi:ribosome-associated translation inhibitor RaiA